MFTGCNYSDNKSITINDERYEIANHNWKPYGDSEYDGKYYLFKNSSNIIFAKAEENNLFEPLIYHNSDDVYPDVSMADRVDRIILQLDGAQIELDSDIAKLLVNELNADSTIIKAVPADISTAEVYVNVYYKDYPAYQNEFVLCYSNNNQLGAMYCETEKNTEKFGKDNMVLFSNNELISYIEFLNLF